MSEQLENALEVAASTVDLKSADSTPPLDPNAPQVAFSSALTLTREQEDRLVNHALQRKEQVEREMGRDLVAGVDNWFAETLNPHNFHEASFMGKRALFDMTYHNHVEWRKFALGGIFEHSNLTVPLARRTVRQMIARANAYFFGSDPWYGVYPANPASTDDVELTDTIDRFAKFKLKQAKTVKGMRRGVRAAFIRGEGVKKVTHQVREQVYRMNAQILVDVSGKPILDANQDYILQSDITVPEVQTDPTTGNTVETGRQILKKDGVTALPDPPIYMAQKVARILPIFRGPETDVVYYQDFLCPLNAPSVHEADFIAHLMSLPVMTVADMFQRRNMAGGEGGDPQSQAEMVQATLRAVEAIRDMDGDDMPKDASSQPPPGLRRARHDWAPALKILRARSWKAICGTTLTAMAWSKKLCWWWT